MISPTTTRVPEHTPAYLNERVADQTRRNVVRYGADAERTAERLEELDREWDIERTLEANASSLVVLGTLLGAFASPWFYWIPFLVGGFLLQHALQGWCPPVRLFRRLGFRTHAEIATEVYALRALRGDFADLPDALANADDRARAEQAYRLLRW